MEICRFRIKRWCLQRKREPSSRDGFSKIFDSLWLAKQIKVFVNPKDKLIRSEVKNKLDDGIFKEFFHNDIKIAKRNYPTRNKRSTKLESPNEEWRSSPNDKSDRYNVRTKTECSHEERRSKTNSVIQSHRRTRTENIMSHKATSLGGATKHQNAMCIRTHNNIHVYLCMHMYTNMQLWYRSFNEQLWSQ